MRVKGDLLRMLTANRRFIASLRNGISLGPAGQPRPCRSASALPVSLAAAVNLGPARQPGSAGRSAQVCQSGGGRVDPLVSGGQRQPDVPTAGSTVERAGRDQDPDLGQLADRLPAIVVRIAGPQIEPGLRMTD